MKDFLEPILKELQKCSNSKAKLYRCKNKEIYEIKLGGKNMLKSIFTYLYKDSTIELERKYNKFREIVGEV